MRNAAAPVPFAGSQLGEMRHGCAFFNGDDEAYRVLLPFIEGGLLELGGRRAASSAKPD